jgi:hypothetical protein
MAPYPPALPVFSPCTAIPAKLSYKRLKSLCFFCASGFAPILFWVAEGFNTPRDVKQVPPDPPNTHSLHFWPNFARFSSFAQSLFGFIVA